jgi:hypothetical protein
LTAYSARNLRNPREVEDKGTRQRAEEVTRRRVEDDGRQETSENQRFIEYEEVNKRVTEVSRKANEVIRKADEFRILYSKSKDKGKQKA